MTRSTLLVSLCLGTVLLSACNMDRQAATPRPAAPPAASTATTAILQGGAQTVAALDTTTPAEKAAATAPAKGGGKLGSTMASLGDATEAGFWVKAPLVKDSQVPVTLVFKDAKGAISRLSLQLPVRATAPAAAGAGHQHMGHGAHQH